MPTESKSERDAVLRRAEEVSATLAQHAAQTENLGRPSPEGMKALEQAGLLALTTPHEFGGHEANWGTQARVAVSLGRGCASTGWVASLSAAAKHMIGPMLAGPAQTAFYADPDAVVSASGVAPGRATLHSGGVRVSGRWPMASGCEEARWASLLVTVVDEREQVVQAGLVLVPIAEMSIDRSWRSVGLQGTGSYTLVAEDLPVAEGFSFVGPLPPTPGLPPAQVSLGARVAHLAPMVGATAAALDSVRDMFAGTRAPSATTYSRIVDSPMARHRFVLAERAVHGALRDTLAVADGLDQLAPGQEPLPEVRSGWRMDLVAAATACRSALEHLLDLRGTGGFAPQESLQRAWRDVAVGTRYAGLNPYIADEDHARVLLALGELVSTS